jgi:CubicO group peptidase (beta-lactamase class C family)
MVKIGQLYLAKGVWEGEQVVSSAWVAAATRRQTAVSGGIQSGYGYQWWVGELEGMPAALAWGYGGQAVAVVPTLRLVAVVSTEIAFNEAAERTTRGLSPGLVKVLLESGIIRNLDS